MFQPVLISNGVVGWQFLKSTYDKQFEAFNKSPELLRETDNFSAKISSIVTAEDLVADRQVLKVALGAFGLEDDLDNRYFIQKMLEEGTTADDSLANRFADSRYRDFSAAFGFGQGETPQTLTAGFAEEIVARYRAQSFEVATGDQDETMRIALYAERTLAELVSEDKSVDAKWLDIMGQPALRDFFETLFNLPQQFIQIDIDQQLGVFKDRASSILGTEDPSVLLEDGVLDDLLVKYVARAQIDTFNASTSSASVALTLLQNI